MDGIQARNDVGSNGALISTCLIWGVGEGGGLVGVERGGARGEGGGLGGGEGGEGGVKRLSSEKDGMYYVPVTLEVRWIRCIVRCSSLSMPTA